MAKLTLDDIADVRAYERERDDFRRDIIELKKRRRVAVGPVVTFLFENSATMRFQVQEMVRAEKILSDDAIQRELDIYNPLISEPGHLAATMFLELTSDEQLREWLPKLVGIETTPALQLGEGDSAQVVASLVDPDHAQQLTRDEITASVHYVYWSLTPDQVEAFAAGPVALLLDHPAYSFEAVLGADAHGELLGDLRDGG